MKVGHGVMLGALLALGGFVILYPAFVPAKIPMHRTTCMSQVKQLGLAMLLYNGDEDHLPPRDQWVDLSFPYVKNWSIYHCPFASGKWGYAFNGALEEKNLDKLRNPETVPMIFDSVNPTKNASDLYKSLPAKPRHLKNAVVYGDGHVKAL